MIKRLLRGKEGSSSQRFDSRVTNGGTRTLYHRSVEWMIIICSILKKCKSVIPPISLSLEKLFWGNRKGGSVEYKI